MKRKPDDPWSRITILVTDGVGISHGQARWCRNHIANTLGAHLVNFPGPNDDIKEWPSIQPLFVLAEPDEESRDEPRLIREVYKALTERFDGVPGVDQICFVKKSFIMKNPLATIETHTLSPKGAEDSSKQNVEKTPEHEQIDFSVYYKNGTKDVACKRKTPLNTKNPLLVGMLNELLEYLHADISKRLSEGHDPYMKALSVLRVWPVELKLCEDVCAHMPDGVHSVNCLTHIKPAHLFGTSNYRNIREALENLKDIGIATCKKLDDYRANEKVCAVRELTKVPFVGTVTASHWYDKYCKTYSLRTVEDLRRLSKEIRLDGFNENQRICLEYIDDILVPVTREVCEKMVFECIGPELTGLGLKYQIVGGYRRGKPTSHDIDIVIAVNDELPDGDYPKVVKHNSVEDRDDSRNILEEIIERLRKSAMVEVIDHLRGGSKWISGEPGSGIGLMLLRFPTVSNIVRRVDLVMTTPKQWPFTILGWSGSKMFQKSIRFYVDNLKNEYNRFNHLQWRLSQKRLELTDKERKESEYMYEVLCKTEEDIFKFLNLEYLPPSERCA